MSVRWTPKASSAVFHPRYFILPLHDSRGNILTSSQKLRKILRQRFKASITTAFNARIWTVPVRAGSLRTIIGSAIPMSGPLLVSHGWRNSSPPPRCYRAVVAVRPPAPEFFTCRHSVILTTPGAIPHRALPHPAAARGGSHVCWRFSNAGPCRVAPMPLPGPPLENHCPSRSNLHVLPNRWNRGGC